MVRVISEKLFSPPRSRHSSGETVDKELAARAVEALPSFANSRRFELSSDYESSSDSHWDSEVDFEEEGPYTPGSETGATGEDGERSTAVLRKRKERRRERNKLSAQAYRVRRRELSVKQQSVLVTLQEENTRLKNQVQELEDEISKFRDAVKTSLPDTMPLATYPAATTTISSSSSLTTLPSTSFPPGPGPFRPQMVSSCGVDYGQEAAENGNGPSTSGRGFASTSSSPFFPSQPAPPVAGQLSFGSCAGQLQPPVTFDMLAQAEVSCRQQQPSRRRQPSQHGALDNARSRQHQISPVVDNFPFASCGSLRRPSPAASPCSSVGSVVSNPATPTPTAPPSPGPAFVFPPAATQPQPLLVPRAPLVGAACDVSNAAAAASEEELLNRRYLMLLQQHKPSGTPLQPHRPHCRQADLNANSDECRNSNLVVMGNSNHQHHFQQAQTYYPLGHQFQQMTGADPRYGLTQAAHNNGNETVTAVCGQPAAFTLCRNDNAFGPVSMSSNNSSSSSSNNNNNNNVSFVALASIPTATVPIATSAAALGAAPLQMLASQPLAFKVTKA